MDSETFHLMDELGVDKQSQLRSMSSQEIEQSVIEAIRGRIREDCSVDELSKEFCISARTFSRRMKGAGLSFRKMFNKIREEEAINLLINTDIPVSEISRALGYTNASNFGKAFVRWTGVSPRKYRIQEWRIGDYG